MEGGDNISRTRIRVNEGTPRFKEGHIAKDCKGKQTIKNRKVKEDSDDEDDKKEEDFGEDLE